MVSDFFVKANMQHLYHISTLVLVFWYLSAVGA